MKIIIPVAGAGTRLRPHTHSLPKPLLHVAGKPIIAHLLDPLVSLNPEEVLFIIGFRGELIKQYVQENYSFNATFIEQDKLLGLGYAINLVIKDIEAGELLILLGDTIVECDFEKFVQAGDNVLGLMQVHDPERFGIAVIKDGQVVDLEEKPMKPKTNLAIIGLYYFKDMLKLKRILDNHVSSGQVTRGEIQFTDALQDMIKAGESFIPYEVSEWFDCGKKETMLSTNSHIIKRLNQQPKLPGSKVFLPVYVHHSATVTNSVIGPNVSISAGTKIDCCIIKNSIIGEKSDVKNMVLDNSLIGNEVRLHGRSFNVNIGDSSEIDPV